VTENLCFINGAFSSPTGPAQAYFSPITGGALGNRPLASPGDVDRAVQAARAAFDTTGWSMAPPHDRAKLLRRVAQLITEQAEAIAEIDAVETGKPIRGGLREALGAARVFDYYAGLSVDLCGASIPVGAHGLDLTIREPIGAVGQIVPWNFPFLACAWKLAPALAAGCSCVLSTSPLTPSSALFLARILSNAGLPPGVVNILPGSIDASKRLVAHPGIDLISFTGSTETGRAVMQSAAATLKRVALELGGKSPCLVLEDADIAAAAKATVKAAFGNSGQSCSARSRIYVADKVYAEFLQAFVAETKALVVGDPREEKTDIGPLITKAHRDRVAEHVRRAELAGARIVTGGTEAIAASGGNYFQPTILSDTHQGMAIMQEEVFGPVASVTAINPQDAVALANDTGFGLAASVWTRDVSTAFTLARRIKAGNITINSHPSASELGLYFPFGGFKASGIGRELGRAGLEAYTELKNIYCDISPKVE
jgi:betaine-aldehyde dehydrogenase